MGIACFQGPSSKNPLSYKWYNADEEILGKKMKVGFFSFLFFSFFFLFFFCLRFILSTKLQLPIKLLMSIGLDEIQCCILAHIPWNRR